jgi:hypothetical protein
VKSWVSFVKSRRTSRDWTRPGIVLNERAGGEGCRGTEDLRGDGGGLKKRGKENAGTPSIVLLSRFDVEWRPNNDRLDFSLSLPKFG